MVVGQDLQGIHLVTICELLPGALHLENNTVISLTDQIDLGERGIRNGRRRKWVRKREEYGLEGGSE